MNRTARTALVKVGVTSACALALVGAVASGATAAATTYKVAVGTTTTGTAALTGTSNGSLTFNDTTTGLAATCSSATATGAATLSPRRKATSLATISKSTYSACSANGELELNIVQRGTWTFEGTGPTSNSVTPGVLANITAKVSSSSTNCKFTTAGTVDATYNNSTGVLAFAPLSGTKNVLTISGQTGTCLGLANNGDTVTFTGAFSVKSTSPAGTLSITSR
jgi:hypothetical protein